MKINLFRYLIPQWFLEVWDEAYNKHLERIENYTKGEYAISNA